MVLTRETVKNDLKNNDSGAVFEKMIWSARNRDLDPGARLRMGKVFKAPHSPDKNRSLLNNCGIFMKIF